MNSGNQEGARMKVEMCAWLCTANLTPCGKPATWIHWRSGRAYCDEHAAQVAVVMHVDRRQLPRELEATTAKADKNFPRP